MPQRGHRYPGSIAELPGSTSPDRRREAIRLSTAPQGQIPLPAPTLAATERHALQVSTSPNQSLQTSLSNNIKLVTLDIYVTKN